MDYVKRVSLNDKLHEDFLKSWIYSSITEHLLIFFCNHSVNKQ